MDVNSIYVIMGSAFTGAFIMAIYKRLNGNGNAIIYERLARLEEKVEHIESEVKDLKELIIRVMGGRR